MLASPGLWRNQGCLWNPCSEVRGRLRLPPTPLHLPPLCVFFTLCLCPYKHTSLLHACVCMFFLLVFLPLQFHILHPSVSCWLSVHTSASVSYHLWECQLGSLRVSVNVRTHLCSVFSVAFAGQVSPLSNLADAEIHVLTSTPLWKQSVGFTAPMWPILTCRRTPVNRFSACIMHGLHINNSASGGHPIVAWWSRTTGVADWFDSSLMMCYLPQWSPLITGCFL